MATEAAPIRAAPVTTHPAPTAPQVTTTTLPLRSPAKLGVFVGGAHLDQVEAFESRFGRPVGPVLVFIDEQDLSDPHDVVRDLGSHRAVWSPKLPDIARVARGDADATIAAFARHLVSAGQGDAVLRPFWEFNGPWMNDWYSAGRTDTFVAAWRRFAEVVRTVPDQSFTFEWAANVGEDRALVEASYPGDDVVDLVGLDIYDQGWTGDRLRHLIDAPVGLDWHRRFATAHAKQRAFGEWGLTIRPDGHGGGDDPAYVDLMADEILRPDVAYACYFDQDAPDGVHRLVGGRFPKALARFRQRFAPVSASGVEQAPHPGE